MSVTDELQKITALLTNAGKEMRLSRRERLQARPKLREHPDPIPIALPVGMETPPTMRELVQEYVEGALSKHAASQQLGTFKEEDDFEEDDHDLLPMSQYEVHEFDMVEENPLPDAAPAEPSEGEPQATAELRPEPEKTPDVT